MAKFENPNDPIQPKGGVYCWYAEKNHLKIAIYVGQAGGRQSFAIRGTLFCGVREVQRNTFSSDSVNSYRTIDVDFIVGTAIVFLEEEHGFECIWRHVDDEPKNEGNWVRSEKPILQDINGRVKEELRLRKEERGYWKLAASGSRNGKVRTISEAQGEIRKRVKVLMNEKVSELSLMA